MLTRSKLNETKKIWQCIQELFGAGETEQDALKDLTNQLDKIQGVLYFIEEGKKEIYIYDAVYNTYMKKSLIFKNNACFVKV